MSIEILKLTLGPLQTNCYIVGDTDTNDAVVIDPSDQAALLFRTAQDRGWTIREILATHGHFDHIMASRELKDLTGALFRANRHDHPLIKSMPTIVRQWMRFDVQPAADVDTFVKEGDTITVGSITLDVLFTPGHSPGHISFVMRDPKIVFSGDCLFLGGVGRTDLAGGDHDVLMRSITTKLLPLGDEYAVAPGHSHGTTIGYERANNGYILDYLESLDMG